MSDVRLRPAPGWRAVLLRPQSPVAHKPDRIEASSARDLTNEQWCECLRQLIDDPSQLPEYSLLKIDRGSEVLRARFGDGESSVDVVCRRTRESGLMCSLFHAIHLGRPRRNLRRALTLARAGINTAHPLALLERRPPACESWLVSAYVPDMVDLDRVATDLLPRVAGSDKRRARNLLINAIVELFITLERNGLAHRDLKASNIMVRDWDAGALRGGIWLVDLDGLRRRASWQPSRRWQPLMRLTASLLDYPAITNSDYARFLRRFMRQAGLDENGWRSRFKTLAQQANEYVRRSRGRKSHKLEGYGGA